jgi:hypothetical protein
MAKPIHAKDGYDPSAGQRGVVAEGFSNGGNIDVQVCDSRPLDVDATGCLRSWSVGMPHPEAPLGEQGLSDRQIPLGREAHTPRDIAGQVPGCNRLEVEAIAVLEAASLISRLTWTSTSDRRAGGKTQ